MKNLKKEKNAPGPEKIAREKLPPEKYWDRLVKTYFMFYRRRVIDPDGFPLDPDWNEQKRGMEAKGFKEIIVKLRTITEAKNIEWTEAVAIDEVHNFLQKGYNIPFIKKTMLCCIMNKFKDMIICSEYTPSLVEKVLNEWYKLFPEYTRDHERDKTAAQITIGYLKQQYIQKNILFTDVSVVQSVNLILRHVKADEWWSQKTFRTVANNLHEFVSKINANKKNGRPETYTGNNSVSKEQSASSNERIEAISNFTITTRESIRRGDSERDKI